MIRTCHQGPAGCWKTLGQDLVGVGVWGPAADGGSSWEGVPQAGWCCAPPGMGGWLWAPKNSHGRAAGQVCACNRAGLRGFTRAGTTGFAPFPSLGCGAQPAPPPHAPAAGGITITNARAAPCGAARARGQMLAAAAGKHQRLCSPLLAGSPAAVVSGAPRRGHGRAGVVRASSPRTLLPSQNGSPAGAPIPAAIPYQRFLQPCSFPTALCPPVEFGGADQSPPEPLPPWPPCTSHSAGTGWDGAFAVGCNVALGNQLWELGSLSQVCACSPLPLSQCQLCRPMPALPPHASSITPSQAAPRYFPPSSSSNFIILSCINQPERENNVTPARTAGNMGFLRAGGCSPRVASVPGFYLTCVAGFY